jgi:hypothetical protein
MGNIARSVRSKRLPFAQINETVKLREQLKTVVNRYDIKNDLQATRKRRDWSVLSRAERMFQEIGQYFHILLLCLQFSLTYAFEMTLRS